MLNGSSLRAVGPALRELCGGGRCDGITGDPRGDVAALVRRLEARRIERPGHAGGRRAPPAWRSTPSGLFGIVLAGDLDPTLRAELPAAVRSALRGDVRPILRLQLRAAGLTPIPEAVRLQAEGGDSDALLVATRCEESIFPWDRAAGPAQRAAQARRAVRAIPRARFGAFSGRVALDSDVIPVCVGWPNAAPAPAAPAARARRADADHQRRGRRAHAAGGRARRSPRGSPAPRCCRCPFAGHSVAGQRRLGLRERRRRGLLRRPARSSAAPARTPCSRPAPIAPTSLARVPGADRARRTIAAVRATLRRRRPPVRRRRGRRGPLAARGRARRRAALGQRRRGRGRACACGAWSTCPAWSSAASTRAPPGPRRASSSPGPAARGGRCACWPAGAWTRCSTGGPCGSASRAPRRRRPPARPGPGVSRATRAW